MPPGLTLVLRLFLGRVLYQRRVTTHDQQNNNLNSISFMIIFVSIRKAGFKNLKLPSSLVFQKMKL